MSNADQIITMEAEGADVACIFAVYNGDLL